MEQLARDLGLQDQAEFCGNLPAGAAVVRKLDESDLFVLPSRQEGMPRAAIEAMARALPCICRRVGGIPELIGTGELVPADDVAALSVKLSNCYAIQLECRNCRQRNLKVAAGFASDVLRGATNAHFMNDCANLTENLATTTSPQRIAGRRSALKALISSINLRKVLRCVASLECGIGMACQWRWRS